MSYFFYMNVNVDKNNNDFINKTLVDHGFYGARILKEKEVQIDSDIKIGKLIRIALWLSDDYPEYLKIINEMRKEYKAIYILKHWEGKGRITHMFPTETINCDDLSIKFLSEINDDTFYRIEFFKRYF